MNKITRRDLLVRGAGAGAGALVSAKALAASGSGQAQGLTYMLEGVIPSANAAAFFSNQAGASSDIINGRGKTSAFPNVPFNTSASASIVATVLPELLSDIPVEGMRLFTQHAGPIAEILALTIYPPGTPLTVAQGVTSWGLPMLRVKAQTTAGVATFVGMLPRWDAGVWQTIIVLLNDVTRSLQAGVTAFQFLKNQRSPSLEQMPIMVGYPNRDRPTSAIVNVPMNLPVGMTGSGSQLDITIGRIPNTFGPGSQGSLQNTTIGSVTYSPQAADPNYTISQAVHLPTGAFINPGYGAHNAFTSTSGYSPVALIGEVLGDGLGFMRNYGIINSSELPEGVYLDTRFGNSGTNLVDDAQSFQDPFGP